MLTVFATVALLQAQSPADALELATSARAGDSIPAATAHWEGVLASDPDHAFAALALGFVDVAAYRYDRAAARFESLVTRAARAEVDAHVAAYAQYGRGVVETARGDHPAAASAFVGAVERARMLPDSALVARAWSGAADAALRTEGLAAALALADSARLWLDPDSPAWPAYVCARAGFDTRVPLATIQEAADAAAARGDPIGEGRCLLRKTIRFTQVGASDSVRAAGARARDRLERANDLTALATALQWTGYYERSIGTYHWADSLLHRAVEVGTAAGNASTVAWSLINLAALASSLGDVTAVTYMERAAPMLREQGDRIGIATLHQLEGELWYRAGDFGRARAAYLEGLDVAEAIGQTQQVMSAHAAMGRMAMRSGDFSEARTHFDAYADIVRRSGLTGWQYSADINFADLALYEGDLRTADALYTALLPVGLVMTRDAQVLNRMAEVRARLSDADSARVLASAAADLIDEWRATVDDQRLRLYALQQDAGNRGVATTVAALSDAGLDADAFEISERRRARELLDQVARRDALSGRSTPDPAPEVVPLSALQAALTRNEAVIAWTTGASEPTTVTVVTSGAVHAVRAPPIDEVQARVERIASLLATGEVPPELLEELSAAVLQPALALVPDGVDELLLVVEDALQRIPLDLLPLGDGGIVADRFATSTVPSASVAMALRGRSRDAREAAVLSLGNPVAPALRAHPTFADTPPPAPLPGSGREARLVGRFAERSEVRTGAEASEAFLRSADLTGFDIVHLATHALVDPRASTRTAVLLSPGDGADGIVTAADLAGLKLDARLVVLSSCRSGGGQMVRGEGIQGLTGPLLGAGADAVLATAWEVDDAEVGRFVERFYRGLAAGRSASHALRDARLAARDAGRPVAVWGAFFLVGNGGVTVPLTTPRPRARVFLALLAGMIALVAGVTVVLRTRADRRGLDGQAA